MVNGGQGQMDWCSNSPFGVAFRPSVVVSSCLRVRSDHPAGLRTTAMRLGNRLAATLCVLALSLSGCAADVHDPRELGSASARLKPVAAPLAEPTLQRTVYVPVYSSMYLGRDIKQNMVQLSVTMSIRNVSSRHPLVLNFVRYYDSAGHQIREYVSSPSELAPLATVEFVIKQADTTGGPGANFLVQWAGSSNIDDPVIEAVMIGQSGNAGFSFTSPGRVVKDPRSP
jgi:Protein of unknown function (DUF3124)